MAKFRSKYFSDHKLEFFTQDKYYKADVYIYGRDYKGKTGYLGTGEMEATLNQYAPGWRSQPGGRVIQYPTPPPEKAFPVDPRIRAVFEYHEAHGRFPSSVPPSKGSTGRTTPNNLKEQLAMEEVMSDPGGVDLPIVMSDPRWPASEGWVKRSQNVNGVEIHYLYNKNTGEFDDFKFKDY
jgi:filamentous hemagglutinin